MNLQELLRTPPFSHELPENPVERTKTFAFELAYGANMGLWYSQFLAGYEDKTNFKIFSGGFEGMIKNDLLNEFVQYQWPAMLRLLDALKSQGYLEGGSKIGTANHYSIGPKAWNLLDAMPLSRIFISYSNAESSAFALLFRARLKEFGLNPYLDITNLEGGQDWEKTLEDNIITSDTIIVLIGPTTLTRSLPVRKEIEIALRENKRIIPVLHNGCRVESLKGSGNPFAEIFERLQCVTVEGEKARYYNLAVLDVLNIFRVNP